jgi:hypothetical protein
MERLWWLRCMITFLVISTFVSQCHIIASLNLFSTNASWAWNVRCISKEPLDTIFNSTCRRRGHHYYIFFFCEILYYCCSISLSIHKFLTLRPRRMYKFDIFSHITSRQVNWRLCWGAVRRQDWPSLNCGRELKFSSEPSYSDSWHLFLY